jgi:hypothetical protein
VPASPSSAYQQLAAAATQLEPTTGCSPKVVATVTVIKTLNTLSAPTALPTTGAPAAAEPAESMRGPFVIPMESHRWLWEVHALGRIAKAATV